MPETQEKKDCSMMLKVGDTFAIRRDAWPANQLPGGPIGEVEKAILDPVDGPIYFVWLANYECTTVYGWEIEKL